MSNNKDGRIKLTREMELKIVAVLRRWNSKITWDLLIECIKNELDFSTTKPTLRKLVRISREFDKAKARYNGANNLPANAVKRISTKDVDYYEKYIACLEEKKVLQDVIYEQLAFIDKMLKNAEEIRGLDVNRLIRERPEEF